MESNVIIYNMTDIYDSYFVHRQIPSLSRMPGLRELVNDKGRQTQEQLTKLTGLSPDADSWDNCIFYKDGGEIVGSMLIVNKDSDKVLIKNISINNDSLLKDVFLLMLSRAIRNMELMEAGRNQLYIELPSSDFYYVCVEYLGEGSIRY